MDDTTISIISIVIGVIIAIVPFFYRRFFARPELTIELLFSTGSSNPNGYSVKNDFSKESIPMDEVIQIFELTWRYKLIIRNNSEYDAFYPVLLFNPQKTTFTHFEKLNQLIPIEAKRHIELDVEYSKFEEKIGHQRTNTVGFPDELRDIQILLEYKNSHKIKCFTLYDNNTQEKNKFLIRQPKAFKSNN